MDLLLAALGTFAIVEFIKIVGASITGTDAPPWWKAFLGVMWALILTGTLTGWDADTVPAGVGAAGLAAVIHKVHRLLSAAGDAQQVAVLSSVRPRRF